MRVRTRGRCAACEVPLAGGGGYDSSSMTAALGFSCVEALDEMIESREVAVRSGLRHWTSSAAKLFALLMSVMVGGRLAGYGVGWSLFVQVSWTSKC